LRKKLLLEANANIINEIKCLRKNFSEFFLQNLTDKINEKILSVGDYLFMVNFLKKNKNYLIFIKNYQ